MRSNFEQELHDDFVNLVSSFLRERGYNYVKSVLSLDSLPPKINGYMPDVFAEKIRLDPLGNPQIIDTLVIAVETTNSKRKIQSIKQHKALEEWAKNNKADFKLVIAK